jgi:SET domain-containing protein
MTNKKTLSRLKKRPRIHGYISPHTETRISRIQGLGLFATKNIKKGTVVAAWGGCVTTTKEIKSLASSIGYHYALELYPGFYLAERSASELDSADFINHSCSANCKNVNKFIMATKRDVKKNEELTSDFSNHKKHGQKFFCNCGSEKCKRVIYFD